MNIYVKKGTQAQLPHYGCSCKRKGHIKEIFLKQQSQQLQNIFQESTYDSLYTVN